MTRDEALSEAVKVVKGLATAPGVVDKSSLAECTDAVIRIARFLLDRSTVEAQFRWPS